MVHRSSSAFQNPHQTSEMEQNSWGIAVLNLPLIENCKLYETNVDHVLFDDWAESRCEVYRSEWENRYTTAVHVLQEQHDRTALLSLVESNPNDSSWWTTHLVPVKLAKFQKLYLNFVQILRISTENGCLSRIIRNIFRNPFRNSWLIKYF